VLVINLDHRPERLEQFENMARTIGYLQGWERIPAVNGVDIPGYGKQPWFRNRKRDKGWAGRAGCTLSHRKAIEHARDKGWDSVLILEDDIQLGGSFESDAAGFLKCEADHPGDWAVCYLGSSKQIGPSRKLRDIDRNRAVYEIFGCNGTFAYLLKREAFDWILANLPTEETVWGWVCGHRAIDRWYARNLTRRFRVHAVSPNLIGHYTSFSDIGQRAGADLAIQESEEDDHDQLKDVGRLAFEVLSRMLRMRFLLARAVNRARMPLARMRGL
jgi:hypothetical protein